MLVAFFLLSNAKPLFSQYFEIMKSKKMERKSNRLTTSERIRIAVSKPHILYHKKYTWIYQFSWSLFSGIWH